MVVTRFSSVQLLRWSHVTSSVQFHEIEIVLPCAVSPSNLPEYRKRLRLTVNGINHSQVITTVTDTWPDKAERDVRPLPQLCRLVSIVLCYVGTVIFNAQCIIENVWWPGSVWICCWSSQRSPDPLTGLGKELPEMAVEEEEGKEKGGTVEKKKRWGWKGGKRRKGKERDFQEREGRKGKRGGQICSLRPPNLKSWISLFSVCIADPRCVIANLMHRPLILLCYGSPSPPVHNVWTVMTIWRIAGKIIRTVVVLHCLQQLCTVISKLMNTFIRQSGRNRQRNTDIYREM